jgi:ectoine hydroxylase-related dioxygenase (phytanoyl-CoA dioxygenase family)
VQRRPYLRAVRPGRAGDAQPLHRDTYYGASPYEVSVLVPFTSMGEDAALRVIPGSHLAPDADYPFVQTASAETTPRSPRHELGYPYAPRLLDPALDASAVAVPLRLGQAAIFGLSLVHGGGVNAGTHTRFSTDIRVVNAWAPVRIARGVDDRYFEPLCVSSVSRSARQYLDANADVPPSRETG